MKVPVIYSIDYLMNGDISDDDLHILFDTKSLLYSLIIGEFREINSTLKNEEIIKLVKKKNWQYNFYWTKKQFESYENKLFKIYKNLYSYNDTVALSKAQNFMILYALTNINQKKYKKKYILND